MVKISSFAISISQLMRHLVMPSEEASIKLCLYTFIMNWLLRNLLLAVRIGAAFKTDPFETGIAVFVGKVEEMQKN